MGVLLGFLGGCLSPGSPNPDLIFPQLFSTWPPKSVPVFRPSLLEIMSSLLKLERQVKDFLESTSIRMSLFLSYSFGIETKNTFIHSRSSLENHTRFLTKFSKMYNRFLTEKALKPYPLGRHIPIRLI